jgi:hypothetical protein
LAALAPNPSGCDGKEKHFCPLRHISYLIYGFHKSSSNESRQRGRNKKEIE